MYSFIDKYKKKIKFKHLKEHSLHNEKYNQTWETQAANKLLNQLFCFTVKSSAKL